MTQTQSFALPAIAELHVQFLAILPTIEYYADIAHRNLVNFHDREDSIAETIALTWAWYQILAKRGDHITLSPIGLAAAAVRYVKTGKLLCRSNGVLKAAGIQVRDFS